jgi:hypothetical protein
MKHIVSRGEGGKNDSSFNVYGEWMLMIQKKCGYQKRAGDVIIRFGVKVRLTENREIANFQFRAEESEFCCVF